MKMCLVENIRVIFGSESILILLERLYTRFTIADDSTPGLSTVEALR